jgi:hypothetical protein
LANERRVHSQSQVSSALWVQRSKEMAMTAGSAETGHAVERPNASRAGGQLQRIPTARGPSRLARLREQPERGAVTLELVLAFPFLLALLLLTAQFAMFYFGEEAAHTAASQAVAIARAQGATSGTGQAQGQQILDQVAGGTLPQRSITVTRGAGQATADVTGTIQSLIPGFHLHVSAHAAAPIETWTK